jgi:hypothetical protein
MYALKNLVAIKYSNLTEILISIWITISQKSFISKDVRLEMSLFSVDLMQNDLEVKYNLDKKVMN